MSITQIFMLILNLTAAYYSTNSFFLAFLSSGLWLLSGIFMLLARTTTLPIYGKNEELKNACQMFGFFRLSFYVNFFINVFGFLSKGKIDAVWFFALIISLPLFYKMLINLYPYFTKSKQIDLVKDILCHIHEVKSVTVNDISSKFNIPIEESKFRLDGLTYAKTLIHQNRKYLINNSMLGL